MACAKKPPPGEQGPRKPRVELTIVLAAGRGGAPSGPHDVVTVTPEAPPASRQMFERSGMRVAVVGLPSDGDPEPFMKTAVAEAEAAGSNATVLVSTRCLGDLQPALEKNVGAFWTVPLVVGARCEGAVKPNIGAAALVENGGASKVRVTFDRHTRAFLKVEPLP
ncbi:MAG: hypothetical protein KF819_06150 [Labilithrix sp.]|nr:hypothetical protein [Labilithrix sp.]